jgi:signal transduction histidine kinase
MWWQLGTVANGVVALAYLAIAWAILRPLLKTNQVPSNRLGTATAAIFFTCAVHHGGHAVHMLLPALGVETAHGLALRQAFDWHQALWDVLSAGVGLWYWSLRSHYSPLMRGAALFDDMKERQRQALEINDNIVQGLAVAKMALDLDQRDVSRDGLEAALTSARQIISELLGESGTETRLGPGDLVRRTPAMVRDGSQ